MSSVSLKLSPELLHVWRGIRAHKTPTEIAEGWGRTRTWTNSLIDKLIDLGVVCRAGDLPEKAKIDRAYPWHAVADAPILPPGATLHVEYVPETQRDHRVRPITRVSWPPYDIQGVPYLREDGKRPKDALPDRMLVVVTNLNTGEEWQFRASIRQGWLDRDWSESDTVKYLPHLTLGRDVSPMTRNIATVLGAKALLDITSEVGWRPTEQPR